MSTNKKGDSMNKTKPTIIVIFFCLISGFIYAGGSTEKSPVALKSNATGKRLTINLEQGEHFLHEMKILPLITIKSPPQIAIWLEDSKGNYVETLFVTRKTATQKWSKAPKDKTLKEKIRRQESLPLWAHTRGVQYADGLYLPTRENPLPDSITSASPKGSFVLNTKMAEDLKQFRVLVEINASLDFNEYFPKDACVEDDNYSGGEWGSGQPALIYSAEIDLHRTGQSYELQLIGHSSPDGSNGNIYHDLAKLTTAKDLVRKITVTTGE
jgi:hypothetical protein